MRPRLSISLLLFPFILRGAALYQPHCENAIDEAFQGRSALKQYMPAKPIKRGIKVWCRADSYNGYMCEVQVYTGRSGSAEGGLGKRVVLELSRKLEGKKHHLLFICQPNGHFLTKGSVCMWNSTAEVS